MTEAEWLAATHPRPMLEFIQGTGSDRMRILTASGICRRLWASYPLPVFQTAITICERYADRRATPGELRRLVEVLLARTDSARPVTSDPDYDMKRGIYNCITTLVDLIVNVQSFPGRTHNDLEDIIGNLIIYMLEVDSASFIHDVFGNPFRPVTPSPAWLTSVVTTLARQMYESRDFSAMPILADALQDAGCDNEDILSHCRGPGPHIRGCWVVDELIGRTR